eukprot:scaffold865_cov405-Pavlova_lutheri.AAC.3
MKVNRDRNKKLIYLSEPEKIQKLIKQFNMEDCKTKKIPLDVVLTSEKDGEPCDTTEYQILVGSLLYLSTTTRRDLCQAASQLSRFMACPTKYHLKAAKGVLKYLKATVNHGLYYATDKETRKSRTGYLFLLNGSLFSWQSKLQSTVSTSTTEVEYQPASSAVKEALWHALRSWTTTTACRKPSILMWPITSSASGSCSAISRSDIAKVRRCWLTH